MPGEATDRHCQQAILNAGYSIRCDFPFQRVLDHDVAPCQEYKRRTDEVKTVLHWGQRKLLLSEIEFLCDFEKSSLDGKTVVYAGAAPGDHIPYLCHLFPSLSWVLVDPRKFSIDTSKGIHSHLKTRVEIRRSYFTTEMAQEFKSRSNSTLFISDVRTSEAAEDESQIRKDMNLQKEWVEVMQPLAGMLKFRLPWSDGSTEYLSGKLCLPVWGPCTTTESRLVIFRDSRQGGGNADEDGGGDGDVDGSGGFKKRTYDHATYEQQMFFFNTVQRVAVYPDQNPIPYYKCRCYDCTAETYILRKYGLSIRCVSEESLTEFVENMSKELDKQCNRDKQNPRTIFDDAPNPALRKKRIQKRQRFAPGATSSINEATKVEEAPSVDTSHTISCPKDIEAASPLKRRKFAQ